MTPQQKGSAHRTAWPMGQPRLPQLLDLEDQVLELTVVDFGAAVAHDGVGALAPGARHWHLYVDLLPGLRCVQPHLK